MATKRRPAGPSLFAPEDTPLSSPPAPKPRAPTEPHVLTIAGKDRPGTDENGALFPWLVVGLGEQRGVLCGYDTREAAEAHAAYANHLAEVERRTTRYAVQAGPARGPRAARAEWFPARVFEEREEEVW